MAPVQKHGKGPKVLQYCHGTCPKTQYCEIPENTFYLNCSPRQKWDQWESWTKNHIYSYFRSDFISLLDFQSRNTSLLRLLSSFLLLCLVSVCEPSPRRASRGTVGAAEAALSLFIHMRQAGGSSARTCRSPRGSDVDTLDLFNTHGRGQRKNTDACEGRGDSWGSGS